MLPATATPGVILGILILMRFENFNTTLMLMLMVASALLALTLLRGGAKANRPDGPN